MQRQSSCPWICWLLAGVACLSIVAPALVQAADPQKQVLVLYSTRRDAQIAVIGERELPRILEAGLDSGLDYYSEYIDRARFPDPAYQLALRDFLKLKYKGLQFDLVIALNDLALRFSGEHRDELFPATPLVYFSSLPATRTLPNSTGVTAETNFSGTLELAARLQPEVKRVVVVSGTGGDDTGFASVARAQFRPFESRFAFEYLTGLTTKALEARLAALTSDSIIYYLVVDRDGGGQVFHPLEYLDLIAPGARAPIYCWVDSAMDHGIVGGSLKDQKAQIDAVAGLALKVLRGERADSIPPISPDLNVNQVDWRQLRRWGISEARVPAGTLVRFREPSLWDRYGTYIVAAAVVLLAQSILIAGLLIQKARRQQAEAQVRGKQVELLASYERIRHLGSRLLSAQEGERSRIARELHDDIGQQVALLAIDLELLGDAGQGTDDSPASEALNRARTIARSVHDLSHRLHPARLRLIGLVAAVRGLQQELSRSDVAISFTHERVPSTLPPDLTLCLYRIVQEALQNALKYSRARKVSVHLTRSGEGLTLTVLDDGVGFDVKAAWGTGLGLVSMGERLEAFGGTLEIRSTPGAGTRLEARVPVPVVDETKTIAV
jgi:signal transduction histidine kinase